MMHSVSLITTQLLKPAKSIAGQTIAPVISDRIDQALTGLLISVPKSLQVYQSSAQSLRYDGYLRQILSGTLSPLYGGAQGSAELLGLLQDPRLGIVDHNLIEYSLRDLEGRRILVGTLSIASKVEVIDWLEMAYELVESLPAIENVLKLLTQNVEFKDGTKGAEVWDYSLDAFYRVSDKEIANKQKSVLSSWLQPGKLKL